MVLHYSRRDRWLGGVFGASVLVMIIAAATVRSPSMLLVAAAYVGFIGWIWFGTYYLITGSELVVRCGPFRQTRNVSSIRQVRSTRHLISSPALSLRRLMVDCGEDGFVVISPRDRDAFLRDLKQEAPDVRILID